MSKPQSYKKFNKANKKKKIKTNSENGELSINNSNKRYPIISLPEIATSHIIQEYRRFINNGSATNTTLNVFHLLNQFMFSVTPLLMYNYIRAVRIKKIRLLCPVTTQGTSVQCSLQPLGIDTGTNCFNGVPEKYIDTSASIDVPAYLSLTPSIDTPLGSWHYNVNLSNDLCTVVAPAGSTLDILFEYIMATESTQSSYTRVVAGASVGVLYTAIILNGTFTPVGRPNI